jgi:hypothetical protein
MPDTDALPREGLMAIRPEKMRIGLFLYPQTTFGMSFKGASKYPLMSLKLYKTSRSASKVLLKSFQCTPYELMRENLAFFD